MRVALIFYSLFVNSAHPFSMSLVDCLSPVMNQTQLMTVQSTPELRRTLDEAKQNQSIREVATELQNMRSVIESSSTGHSFLKEQNQKEQATEKFIHAMKKMESHPDRSNAEAMQEAAEHLLKVNQVEFISHHRVIKYNKGGHIYEESVPSIMIATPKVRGPQTTSLEELAGALATKYKGMSLTFSALELFHRNVVGSMTTADRRISISAGTLLKLGADANGGHELHHAYYYRKLEKGLESAFHGDILATSESGFSGPTGYEGYMHFTEPSAQALSLALVRSEFLKLSRSDQMREVGREKLDLMKAHAETIYQICKNAVAVLDKAKSVIQTDLKTDDIDVGRFDFKTEKISAGSGEGQREIGIASINNGQGKMVTLQWVQTAIIAKAMRSHSYETNHQHLDPRNLELRQELAQISMQRIADLTRIFASMEGAAAQFLKTLDVSDHDPLNEQKLKAALDAALEPRSFAKKGDQYFVKQAAASQAAQQEPFSFLRWLKSRFSRGRH